jgi:hypothetical protein
MTQGKKTLRHILLAFLVLALAAPSLLWAPQEASAKGSLAAGDSVKNVLIYARNAQGDDVLVTRLAVEDMLDYLNANFASIGRVHNYSILDQYPTVVHQEAQGFSVEQFLDYAKANSGLPAVSTSPLRFENDDQVSFWEIDDDGYDAADTYAWTDLYGEMRYNYPAMYQNWNDYTSSYVDKDAVRASARSETVVLSVTAFSERYFLTVPNKEVVYMEGYFDDDGRLDTARTVRLMLPLTAQQFEDQAKTASNSRYGICYILFNMKNKPALPALGHVGMPSYAVIDGDADATDAYDAGYWYFNFEETPGVDILYNDASASSYMPTALYAGEAVKIRKDGNKTVSFNFRAVREGYTDEGVMVANSDHSEDLGEAEEVPAGAEHAWDGTAANTAWYDAGASAYEISTGAELAGLASLVNGGNSFAGKTVKLTADIHLNGHPWSGIGTVGSADASGAAFSGSFDGQGHAVSGLPAKKAGQVLVYAGFFGKTVDATLKNLTLRGSLAATSAAYAGVFVGYADGGRIENCVNRVQVETAFENGSVGGIAGEAHGTQITDSANYADITSRSLAAGLVAAGDATIERSFNYGTLAGGESLGAAYGLAGAASAVTDSANFGDVAAARTAGLVGAQTGAVRGSVNFGRLSGEKASGLVESLSGSLTDSYNAGTLSAAQSFGLAGTLLSGTAVTRSFDYSGNPLFGEKTGTQTFDSVYYLGEQGSPAELAGSTEDLAGVEPHWQSWFFGNEALGQTALKNWNSAGNGTTDGYFVKNEGAYPALHWQRKDLRVTAEPAEAQLTLRNAFDTAQTPSGDGTYALMLGEIYTATAAAEGWLPQTLTFRLTDQEAIAFRLDRDLINTDKPRGIVLSLTGDPKTEIGVVWSLPAGGADGTQQVQYLPETAYSGDASFAGAASVAAAAKTLGGRIHYEAKVTGLSPGTSYRYRVGGGDAWSEASSFTTEPDIMGGFSFLYVGDINPAVPETEYPLWGSLLEKAYEENPEIAFGIQGGDAVENGQSLSEWEWLIAYAQSIFDKIPLAPVIGNHESNAPDGSGKAPLFLDNFNLAQNGPEEFKEEFYSFDYGDAHFTVLNSWTLSDEQKILNSAGAVIDQARMDRITAWIEADLAAAKDAKFRIISLHHPAYPHVTDKVSAAVRQYWLPLFEAGGVDLALVGHQHVYSRTHPLTNGVMDHENGITWVMGNSGKKFYYSADGTYSDKLLFGVENYQIVDVRGNTLSLRTYDRDGMLLDSFTMQSRTGAEEPDRTDVNGDGRTDETDVTAVKNAVLRGGAYNAAYDMNGDGTIDVRDAQLIRRALQEAS